MPLSIHATYRESFITLESKSGPNNLSVTRLIGPVLLHLVEAAKLSTDFFDSQEPTEQVLVYSDGSSQELTRHMLLNVPKILHEFRSFRNKQYEEAVQISFQPLYKEVRVRFNPDNRRLLLVLKGKTFYDQIVLTRRN